MLYVGRAIGLLTYTLSPSASFTPLFIVHVYAPGFSLLEMCVIVFLMTNLPDSISRDHLFSVLCVNWTRMTKLAFFVKRYEFRENSCS
jgi:hypothetical protein